MSNWGKRGVRAIVIVSLSLLLAGSGRAQDGGTYVVQPGDTLAKIALLSTGDAMRHQELFDANEDALDAAGGLQVGMELVLPSSWPQPDINNVDMGDREARDDVDEDGVSADTVITPAKPPPPNVIDLLAYLPSLRELNEDFDVLMLRAAYEGDIGWGEKRVETNRETRREQLQQQILQAEVDHARASAEADACELRAARAERILAKFQRDGGDEYQSKMEDILQRLGEAVWREQQLWSGKLWPYLSEAARNTWLDYAASLERESDEWDWVEVMERHDDLDAYRVGIRGVEILSSERDAFDGIEVTNILGELQALRTEKAYITEIHQQKRYREALEDLQDRADCVREFYNAADFLEEKRRKLRSLQIGSGVGGGDALSVDASRVANRYAGVLAEAQLIDSFLTNRMWTDLWWKAGVARRLAGDHDLGSRLLAQAAAVANEARLPEGEIPPSLDSWLRSAENEVLRQTPGSVHVLVPPLAKLTIDGNDVEHTFGEADIELSPGIHRFVFWVGNSRPIMRLIGVYEDGDHDFIWYQDSDLGGEEEALIGEVPQLPVLPTGPQTKLWHTGVSAQGGLALGRPVFGADVTVRYLPKWIGGELGISVLVPTRAYWLRAREELYLFGRVHGGIDFRGQVNRFSIVGTVGGYADPLLGAGPRAKLEFAIEALDDEKLRVSLDVSGGYDLTKHMDGVQPYVLNGGIGFWF